MSTLAPAQAVSEISRSFIVEHVELIRRRILNRRVTGNSPAVEKSAHSVEESGLLTTEFVLLYGLVLALVMSVVHFGLLYNAALAVSDAADVALEVAQARGGRLGEARRLAREVVGSAQMVRNLSVDVTKSGGQVTVNVAAQSPSILPGLPTAVSRSAQGPIERFIPEGSR